MTIQSSEQTVLVRLPVRLVDALLKMRESLDPEMSNYLADSITGDGAVVSGDDSKLPASAPLPTGGRYAAEFLGVQFAAPTLPEVFAAVVDMTAAVAPEALEVLATMQARTRRYVARVPEAIHPGRGKLPVMRTASGWWISKNIGQEDLRRALAALCKAGCLTFGVHARFPL